MLSLGSIEAAPSGPPMGFTESSCRGRVLVVEQDRQMLERYADLLLGGGYRISAARSAGLAVRLLEAQGTMFDVVVADSRVAGDAAVLRAARDAGNGVPVVMIAGTPPDQAPAFSAGGGALQWLVRPFAEAELLRRVEHASQLRRLEPPACDSSPAGPGSAEHSDELEARFTSALQSLYMTYQPIVRTRDASVYGWEALLRTREPALSGALPFLALAERLGRTKDLGRSIRAAVASVASQTRGVMFFVNLHHDDLLDDNLFDPRTPLAARASEVVLEISERRPIESVPDFRTRLARLRSLGFRIAIDDLGAGYAGMHSLALIEPDLVKLDRALVSGLDHDAGKRRLVESLVCLSRDAGEVVIAEGVEVAAEQDALLRIGCDLMQGFFFRAPGELRGEGRFELPVNLRSDVPCSSP